jgi:polygalacturonase
MITGAPFNVKDYGAKGDGTTDDTSAFAAAVTAVSSNGGGALYIPKGIYKYTNFLIDCSNVRVYGDGTGITVLQPNGWIDGIRFANGYPSATALLSDVGIQNITIDCVNQTSGANDTYGNGVNLNACDQFYVRFCEIIKHKQQGIVSTYYQVGSVKETAGYITDNIVDSALSSSNISIGVEGNSSNVTVTNNTVFNAVNVGIYCGNLSATLTAGNVIISNNNVSCVTGNIGIRVEDVYKNITITGNQISNFDVGIRGSTTAGAATDTYLIANNLISGFISQGILLSPLASGSSNRSLVIGNSLLTSNGAGSNSYAISCASDAHITGNYINANTVSAIYASGTNITIQSNTCLGATGSYSIDVSATTSAVVVGNFLSSDLYLGTTTQATANLGGSTQRWTQNYMGTKQFISNPNTNSTPTSGTWVAGDTVWNANPASGGYVGLICTVSGTPGTWKTFGLIS